MNGFRWGFRVAGSVILGSALAAATSMGQTVVDEGPGDGSTVRQGTPCERSNLAPAAADWAHEVNDPARIRFFANFADNWVRGTFNTGRVEWDSNCYFGYSLNPCMTLMDYGPTPKLKLQGQAVCDWMAITMALHYLDGNVFGPDIRAKSGPFAPLSGSAWCWAYLWFQDDAHKTSIPEEQMIQAGEMQMVGSMAWATYRPPQVAIDLAHRKYKTPVEMHNAKPFYHVDFDDYADWKGNTERSRRFDFETLYLEENYTLGSTATQRPDGKVGTFSEQLVWGLAVRGDKYGRRCVFGNAGERTGCNGRCPYEEIGQHRNAMLRVLKGTDNAWICVPNDVKQEILGQNLMADLGSGVYIACIPLGAKGLKPAEAFGGKTDKKTGKATEPAMFAKYTWTLDPAKVGALALEVGCKKDHGSYEQFKAAILSKAQLAAAGDDAAQYTSTLGRALKVQFMPTVKYTGYSKMHCGDVEPAGTLPKVWCDGQAVDFGKWQSYHVVLGEPIVEQNWGSGVLTAKTDGKGVQIIVDPATAEVTYRKIGP